MKTIIFLKYVIVCALIFTFTNYYSHLALGALPTGPDGPIIPEPKIPEENLPPTAPKNINLVERTSTSISIKWLDSSDFEDGYDLQRKSLGGAWETISSWTSIGFGEISYDDIGLNPDTLYSYRVRIYNDKGATFSLPRTIYTKDGNENAVWRVEITFHTSNISDSDTDDDVFVRLNAGNTSVIPNGNMTWLDYGRNDFEKGDEFTYTLLRNGISELEDITQIYISKTDTNGWCIEDFTLKVNGQEVYNEDLRDNVSGCQWLDNGDGHLPTYVVPHEKLRNHIQWSNYNHTLAEGSLLVLGIPNEEMTSGIEGMIGNANHNTQLYWGHLHGPAVEITSGCPDEGEECKTLHIDLDLAADVDNGPLPGDLVPDPEVDIDFDIEFECAEEGILMTTTNVNIEADSDWFWEVLSLGTINLIDNEVEDRIKSGFRTMPRTLGGESNFCLFVNSSGDIIIEPGENENSGNNPSELPSLPLHPIEAKPVEVKPVPTKPINIPSIPMKPIMLH